MNFINLQVFWLAPVIIILMLLLFWFAQTKRKQILGILFGANRVSPEHIIVSQGRRIFRFFLLIIISLLLLTAIARPWWGNRLIPYESKTRDLLVLFDVSKSMLAEDVPPSRLEHAKWLLRQLVDASAGDRFGLVAFAGEAFLECPFTIDKTSFNQYVDELSVDSIPLGGTNLEQALREATAAFRGAESDNRAIIMITDGEELTGDSSHAISELKRLKIPLFIVGVGSPNTPALVPMSQGQGQSPTFMRDAKDKLVKVRLNEALLKRLAKDTNGVYVRSSVTDPRLALVQRHIAGLVPETTEEAIRTRPIERFHYFLAVAIGLFFLWLLLSERGSDSRVSSRAAQLFLPLFLSALIMLVISPAQAEPEDMPSDAPAPTLSPDEVQMTESPRIADDETQQDSAKADDPVVFYNSGRSSQESQKLDKAAEQYGIAINLADQQPEVRRRAFQNLGVLEHSKAREQISRGVTALQQQNPDEAAQQLEQAIPMLQSAEEMYIKSMSIRTSESETTDAKESTDVAPSEKAAGDVGAVNQQLLLNDRETIDKLKQMIEELKQRQQEAREKTQQAKNKQQQQQQQQQQQEQQREQKQSDQEQSQSGSKKQNKQQQATQQALDNARDAVNKLKEQAEKLKQNKIEENAQKADENLEQAQKSVEKQQNKQAEEHISRALQHLGKEQPKQSDKNDKNDQSGKSDKKNQSDKDKPSPPDKKNDSPEQQPIPSGRGKEQKEESKIDPKQTKAILEMMAGQEKDFRRALKEHQKQIRGETKVEKDW